MFTRSILVSFLAGLFLAVASFSSRADDHPYTEGPVVNVEAVRTANGKFDEYMKWLDTVWKLKKEAAKKAGYVLGYQVLKAEPRTENDPDLYLVITYRNWAVMDGMTAKEDALEKQVEGSLTTSNQTNAERDKIRRVLGSETVQVLELK